MLARIEVDGVVPGAVLPIDRYLVDPQALWKLGHGGVLYLVAKVKRAVYLVAMLEQPERAGIKKERSRAETEERKWFTAWHQDRGEAMPQLVRNLPSPRFSERLEAIADAPPDPRIVRYLARRIHAISSSNETLWIQILRESRDAVAWRAVANVLPELANLVEGIDRKLAFTHEPPTSTKLTAPQRARLRAVADALVEDPAEATLIDAIAEHPDDDDPYLIYSDWLLERGHPRGEYIALACRKQRGALTPALARRLAALENVPFLFGAIDEIATQRQRPRPRGIDRDLIVYWTTMNETWLEVARHPLVRALETLALVGTDREERIPGLVAVTRAAPRLRRIEGFSQRTLQRAFAKALGWHADDDAVVRSKL